MRRLALALLLAAAPLGAAGHESRPGYLELRETGPGRHAVLWKAPVVGAYRVPLDPVFPPGCRVTDAGGGLVLPGALLLRATLACPGGLGGRTLAVAGLAASSTDVLVRVHHADGREETHLLKPAAPSVTFGDVPGPIQRALAYVGLGIQHIAVGVDHLLFVLGLLLIVPSRLTLVKTISAFTVAHSITLAAATLGVAKVPAAAVEATIALSILFLGPEIVRSWRGGTSLTLRHPWVVAFAFGLLHGFGFAGGLAAMGLPTAEIPLALLLFNVGVELGQLAFVAFVILLERSSRALELRWPRLVAALPGYAVGSLGAYWTIQRVVSLWRGLA